MMKYDFLIVGSGLFGSVFAHEATKQGKKCLVLERRAHIGGNCHTQEVCGINVHCYGAHIFHTNSDRVWRYMGQFCDFNRFVNSPLALYKGVMYNLPFNMNTFCRLWDDVHTPAEAKARIEQQRVKLDHEPRNLEEQALAQVGWLVYERLIKGYSEKQWGRPACEIPAFVLKRIPLRYTFNNNYFDDQHQGIPQGGYSPIFDQLLLGCDVRLGVDFLDDPDYWKEQAEKILFTGALDAYFHHCHGQLDFRSLRFEHKTMESVNDYQGNAVVNHADASVPYTRTIEHKHFEFGKQPGTVVTYEYSVPWHEGAEPCYPVNDERNERLAKQYKAMASTLKDVSFGGRLAEYRYYDMDDTVERVLDHPWLRQR
ncbi:MAG: UDP-galactopyranose mutase [Bacteroidales bacterium]|nr:UDP-galactopyranose mutase [Bacteroidales bacterium]